MRRSRSKGKFKMMVSEGVCLNRTHVRNSVVVGIDRPLNLPQTASELGLADPKRKTWLDCAVLERARLIPWACGEMTLCMLRVSRWKWPGHSRLH